MIQFLVFGAIPVLIGSVCAPVAPRAARRMPPAAAALTLTVLAVTVAMATGLILCALGGVALTQVIPFVRPHDWRLAVLRSALPVPPLVGVVAGTVGGLLLVLALAHLGRLAVGFHRTRLAARDLPCVGGIAIVEDQARHAFAVPGRRPFVVVSTGLLQALGAAERRAVLEHERAHLRRHHAVLAQAVRVAAAANPLMRPVAQAAEVALERWADREAARVIGDSATVAHALGKIARPAPPVSGSLGAPTPSLGAGQTAVLERVQHLLAPPTRLRGLTALGVIAALACWLSSAALLMHVHGAIELAETASRH